MATYSLTEASQAAGRSKSTILRSIKAGRVSAERDALTGGWQIDAAELHRVYGSPGMRNGGTFPDAFNGVRRNDQGNAGDTGRFAELQGRLTDAQRTIDDLRDRLDSSEAERRQTADRLGAVQAQLTALLTDQRAVPAAAPVPAPPVAEPVRRSWWPWKR